MAGPLLHLPVDEWRKQLEVNLTGVVIATQAFAPLVGARRPVRRQARADRQYRLGRRPQRQPVHGPYCATKFGLEGLSESLRRELLPFGVDVIVVAPGAVATPIWDKADETDARRLCRHRLRPGPGERLRAYMLSIGQSGLPPERIGQTVHTALTTARPKVRYTVTPQPVPGVRDGGPAQADPGPDRGQAAGAVAGIGGRVRGYTLSERSTAKRSSATPPGSTRTRSLGSLRTMYPKSSSVWVRRSS